MDPVDNNQFEIKPNAKSKRKIAAPCPNVYLNPALDLLANEDPMCNTAMEIEPVKKRKRAHSCDIAAFENSALDLGISKAAVNEFLVRELENVRKNLKPIESDIPVSSNLEINITIDPFASSMNDGSGKPSESSVMEAKTEPIYANTSDISGKDSGVPIIMPVSVSVNEFVPAGNTSIECKFNDISAPQAEATTSNFDNIGDKQYSMDLSEVPNDSNITEATTFTENCMEISKIDDSGISVMEQKSLNPISGNNNNFMSMTEDLSEIKNDTNIQTSISKQILFNNPSNLSLSFIDRLALDSPSTANQSLCLDDDLNESNIMEIKTITIITKKKRISEKPKSTNPFLNRNMDVNLDPEAENPFLQPAAVKPILEYEDEALNKPNTTQVAAVDPIMPRRLFINDTNSTMSTVNESALNYDQPEYENIDDYRSESPIYENVADDIDNIYNKQSRVLGHDVSRFSARDIININKNNQGNSSNESNDSKKALKHHILKAGNKLSKKVLKTLRRTFKGDKPEHNATLNPYEVPRKPPKQRVVHEESGIENPALNLNCSDEIEMQELDEEDDEEHHYETIKTLRNTRLNMNVTPLRERVTDNIDISQNKSNTPGKKVRFDSTLNKEKIITGNSFDCDIQSPGFDAKIDKYHDELENCINERKFLQQNM